MVATTRTAVTAIPIPEAVSTFFDTPRKGQRPRNWLSTTFDTSEDEIKIMEDFEDKNEYIVTMNFDEFYDKKHIQRYIFILHNIIKTLMNYLY